MLINLLADLLYLLAFLALGLAAWHALTRLPLFPLRALTIEGGLREVTPLQIEAAAGSALQGSFLTVDLDAVREAFEKLPWVRRAQVRRAWPRGLVLNLEEQQAVAHWQQGQDEGAEPRLVNTHGEVFAAASPAPLPRFIGPEGTAARMLARYREFHELLAGIGHEPLDIQYGARQTWQIRLDDGVVLDLGRDQADSRVSERLQRFVGSYRSLVMAFERRLGVVDLRYPNGFAVRLAPGEGKP